ncbi:hypothetical protein C8R46DRAFT_1119893 [Mycena filopes]|nr:hypothetical protein C8R46DRAFT_1119893 [Mycena filopes]
MKQNPLLVPELLNLCILHLRGSTSDLLQCALVARAWVYPAQAQIFSEVTVRVNIRTPSSYARFRLIMQNSPHLIHHIRRLTISIPDPEMLGELRNLPFTSLEHLSARISQAHSVALQQLLGLATLRSLQLVFDERITRDNLWELWGNCRSRLLRHLELDFSDNDLTFPAPPLQPASQAAPVALTVLYLRGQGILDIRLASTLYAWSLGSLKALRLDGPRSLTVIWKDLASVMPALEVLCIFPTARDNDLDLASFPNLSVLRLFIVNHRLTPVHTLSRVLGTITPSSRIRTFIFSLMLRLDAPTLAEIDSQLSARPSQFHTVDVELYGGYPIRVNTSHFPKLSAQNMLIFGSQTQTWWEEVTATL